MSIDPTINESKDIVHPDDGLNFTVKNISLPNFKSNKDGTATITKSATFRMKSKSTKNDFRPTDEELVAINGSMALIDLKKNDLYVFTMLAATTVTDRQYEHFLPQGLIEAADALRGKTWLYDPHKWETSNEIGRILDAYVEDDALYLKVFICDIPENQRILANIFAGIHSGISVGFRSKFLDTFCDSCAAGGRKVSIHDENRCPHQPGTLDEFNKVTTVSIAGVLDGLEVSNAPVPAQKLAGILAKSMSEEQITENETQLGEDQMTEQLTEVAVDESLKSTTFMDLTPVITDPAEAEEAEEEAETDTPVADGLIEQPKPEVTITDAIEVTKITESLHTQDNLNPDGTIKSESSISIKDSSEMTDTTETPKDDTEVTSVKDAVVDTPGEVTTTKDAEGIEHDPAADKKLPMWTTELKAYVDNHVSELKSQLAELKTFAADTKACAEETKETLKGLSRITDPKDGSDPEWAVHAQKQAEQAVILDALVEKTMKVLEAVSPDSRKEVTPRHNEWANKLAKKFVSGGNN